MMATYLNPHDVNDLIRGDTAYALIDIRDWGTFTHGHIPGACVISRGHVEKYFATLVPWRNVQVVFYCATGVLSSLTAEIAVEMGYTKVASIKRGFEAWLAAGYPTGTGWAPRGKAYAEYVRASQAIPSITANELRQRLAGGSKLQILDTRTEGEFLASHLPNANSLPLGDVPLLTIDQAADHQEFVATCAGRARGILGAYLLRRMGVANASFLAGGTAAWRLAGYEEELQCGVPARRTAPIIEGHTLSEAFADQFLAEERIKSVNSQELRNIQLAEEFVYVLDVRELSEYRRGRPFGALHCPATQLILLAESLIGVKNATLVTVCDGRARSSVAASFLQGMGYPKVYMLEGGVNGWRDAGFPLSFGPPTELDYGGPSWVSRLQLGVSAQTERVTLPVFGLDAATKLVNFIEPGLLLNQLTNFLIVDLRCAGDFALSHLPGSRWSSQVDAATIIEDGLLNKSAALVLCCADGRLSILAAKNIIEQGHSNVRVLAGGFSAWERAQFPLEEGVGAQTEIEDLAVTEIGVSAREGIYCCNHEVLDRYLKEADKFAKEVSAGPVWF